MAPDIVLLEPAPAPSIPTFADSLAPASIEPAPAALTASNVGAPVAVIVTLAAETVESLIDAVTNEPILLTSSLPTPSTELTATATPNEGETPPLLYDTSSEMTPAIASTVTVSFAVTETSPVTDTFESTMFASVSCLIRFTAIEPPSEKFCAPVPPTATATT